MDLDELGLTDEELEKVNSIINGISSDLEKVIESLEKGDFDTALSYVSSGKSKSNCPVCQKELSILEADITHNKTICLLKSEECKEEKESLIEKTISVKEDFVPLTSSKKAEKDSRRERVNKVFKLPALPRLFAQMEE